MPAWLHWFFFLLAIAAQFTWVGAARDVAYRGETPVLAIVASIGNLALVCWLGSML